MGRRMNPPLVKGKGKQSFYFQLKQGVTGYGIFSIDPSSNKKCNSLTSGESVSYYANSYLYHNEKYLKHSGFGPYIGEDPSLHRIVIQISYYSGNPATLITNITSNSTVSNNTVQFKLLTPDSEALLKSTNIYYKKINGSFVALSDNTSVSDSNNIFLWGDTTLSQVTLYIRPDSSVETYKPITFIRTTAMFTVNLCPNTDVSASTSFEPTGNWSFKSSSNFYLTGEIQIKKIPGIV